MCGREITEKRFDGHENSYRLLYKRGEKLFALNNGDIIPQIGIGPLKLGASENELLKISSKCPFQRTLAYSSIIYTGSDVMVWIERSSMEISQILVFGTFSGKLMGKYGIGTYFSEMEYALGEQVELTYEISMEYRFPSLPGVSFELADIDVPDQVLLQKPYKTLAPIGTISVFRDCL